VRDLLAYVQQRLPDAEHVESSLDDFVLRAGGKRNQMINLSNITRRTLRRLLGKPNPPPVQLYELPSRLFADAGRPARLGLPPE